MTAFAVTATCVYSLLTYTFVTCIKPNLAGHTEYCAFPLSQWMLLRGLNPLMNDKVIDGSIGWLTSQRNDWMADHAIKHHSTLHSWQRWTTDTLRDMFCDKK